MKVSLAVQYTARHEGGQRRGMVAGADLSATCHPTPLPGVAGPTCGCVLLRGVEPLLPSTRVWLDVSHVWLFIALCGGGAHASG